MACCKKAGRATMNPSDLSAITRDMPHIQSDLRDISATIDRIQQKLDDTHAQLRSQTLNLKIVAASAFTLAAVVLTAAWLIFFLKR